MDIICVVLRHIFFLDVYIYLEIERGYQIKRLWHDVKVVDQLSYVD